VASLVAVGMVLGVYAHKSSSRPSPGGLLATLRALVQPWALVMWLTIHNHLRPALRAGCTTGQTAGRAIDFQTSRRPPCYKDFAYIATAPWGMTYQVSDTSIQKQPRLARLDQRLKARAACLSVPVSARSSWAAAHQPGRRAGQGSGRWVQNG